MKKFINKLIRWAAPELLEVHRIDALKRLDEGITACATAIADIREHQVYRYIPPEPTPPPNIPEKIKRELEATSKLWLDMHMYEKAIKAALVQCAALQNALTAVPKISDRQRLLKVEVARLAERVGELELKLRITP